MNSRERWRAVLKRDAVDRVPCDLWATQEVCQMLCKELSCNDWWQVVDKLQIDTPYEAKPRYIGPKLSADCDIWGVKFRSIDYGTGHYNEPAFHPLAETETADDIKNYRWPSTDWFDYSQIREDIEKNSHRPIRAGYVEPFLVYSYMRGLEQAMIDMVENPELIECAFDCIFDFATEDFERILDVAKGQIDITVPSEDLGSQTGPLFSLEHFRRFHKPRFKKYIRLAHQAGAFVFYHSDGACRDFIPELIEIGIDILNPIQWRCPGMERAALKKDFGEYLVFHGGVDNQQILPFGRPEDVLNEVIKCFDTLGVGGGYICAPCHNIQSNTPVENILQMYETIKEISSDSKYTHRNTCRIRGTRKKETSR